LITISTEVDIRTSTADILRLAVGRTTRRVRQHAGDELSPSRASLLATIAREGPLTPSSLAELERLSRPGVTRMLGKLEAAGLVEAAPAPGDGRSRLVTLSAAGRALHELRHARKSAYLEDVLAAASPQELDLLAEASSVLLRLLEEHE
jgi:DNA-binding MarR family transcriptional regulator